MIAVHPAAKKFASDRKRLANSFLKDNITTIPSSGQLLIGSYARDGDPDPLYVIEASAECDIGSGPQYLAEKVAKAGLCCSGVFVIQLPTRP